MDRLKKNRPVALVVVGIAGMVLLVAIGAVAAVNIAANNNVVVEQEPVSAATPAEAPTPTEIPTEAPTPAGTAVPTEAEIGIVPETTEGDIDIATTQEGILTEDDRPDRLRGATSSWSTNWNRHIIEYDELLSGGPPRDGIPSIDEPRFVEPDEATEWLADNEPVIVLEIDGGIAESPHTAGRSG